jgi:hypothetical protein
MQLDRAAEELCKYIRRAHNLVLTNADVEAEQEQHPALPAADLRRLGFDTCSSAFGAARAGPR